MHDANDERGYRYVKILFLKILKFPVANAATPILDPTVNPQFHRAVVTVPTVGGVAKSAVRATATPTRASPRRATS